jgi:hypothetical protein
MFTSTIDIPGPADPRECSGCIDPDNCAGRGCLFPPVRPFRPHKHWSEMIPHEWGWWWRIPYGWLLNLWRHK